MALINTGPDYTRSGDNFLTRMANAASMIPIPGINTSLSWFLGMAGTAFDAAGWLFQGKIGSAATVAVAGAVSATVNSIGGSFWWINAGSGVASGKSMGTHARALTEGAIGAVTGALGAKPAVLRSYTAGIGSIGGGMSAGGPGQFATAEASRRGQDANVMYANYQAGNRADYEALVAAQRAQGGQAARG